MTDKNNLDTLLREADALAQRGDHGAARIRLEEALAQPDLTSEQRSWALHAMAHACINGGEPQAGDAWFARITELRGAHPHCLCEAHLALGYSHAGAKRWLDARHAFERALAVAGGLACHRASARFHTAKSHYAQRDRRRARREIEMFLTMPGPYAGELREAKELLAKLPP